MIAHCCAENIDITHLDIKTAVLNAPLEELCGVTPPKVFLPHLATSGVSTKPYMASNRRPGLGI
jgi:hypothetical protein